MGLRPAWAPQQDSISQIKTNKNHNGAPTWIKDIKEEQKKKKRILHYAICCLARWQMPVMPALGKLRHGDQSSSLNYKARTFLKKQFKKKYQPYTYKSLIIKPLKENAIKHDNSQNTTAKI